jgi:uncharacterized protein (DUF4415 family)
MKSTFLPKGFPTDTEQWEKLISEAPGEDRLPTLEEEAVLKDAIVSYSLPDLKAKLAARRKRGKGKAPHKVLTAIRFDPDVLEGLRATGRGWQRFVNDTMRERLKTMKA